jgi:hypothetical protein
MVHFLTTMQKRIFHTYVIPAIFLVAGVLGGVYATKDTLVSAPEKPSVAVPSISMQKYAYPVWGFSVQYPFGYAPVLLQEVENTLGLSIVRTDESARFGDIALDEVCSACVVHVTVVRAHLRDEQGAIRTPEEWYAFQTGVGVQYTQTTFGEVTAYERFDEVSKRRSYTMFMQRGTTYDMYDVSYLDSDSTATRIAETFLLEG